MFDIRVTHDLPRAAEWCKMLGRVFDNNRHIMAELRDIVYDAHMEAFQQGGHQGHGGPEWMETDPWWAEHMAGKAGQRAMVWTGKARDTLQVRVRGDVLEVRGQSYLRKFLPGESHTVTERFPVIWDAGDWQKLPEDSGNSGFKTRTITVHEREIFGVYQPQGDELMRRLGEEAGIA